MNRALKEEELTREVALYGDRWGGNNVWFKTEYRDKDTDYIQLTEPVTVTFKPLPDRIVLAARVAMLDAQIKEVRAKLTVKVNGLEEQKQRLLAITHD